jgi:Xaa-Pro aminopeptidase
MAKKGLKMGKNKAARKKAKKLRTAVLLADIPEKNADLRHACGFNAPDPVVFLSGPRRRVLLVNAMEAGRARREARGVDVVTPAELGLSDEEKKSLSGWIAGLLRRERLARVTVGGAFPAALARALEKRGVRVAVTDAPLFPEREIKTARERAALRASQRAAAAAMRRAVALLRAARPDRRGVLRLGRRPLTAERVRAELQKFLIDRGCFGPDLIVACGAQGADPHRIGTGPLRANAPIVLDLFPRDLKTGYWGDLTRTVVRGRASPGLAAMHRAVKAAQAAVLRAIRPGANGAELHRIAVRELEARGFKTGVKNGVSEGFIHGTGHGVGLEIHERPSLGRQDAILKPGHVVTVEPGLYYRKIGGVRIEDTVVVTRGGYRLLAACPGYFEI